MNKEKDSKDKKLIRVPMSTVRTNLIIRGISGERSEESTYDFDWSPYENGWNGIGLRPNDSVKTNNCDIVYSHAAYAQNAYKAYQGVTKYDSTIAKDLTEGSVVKINDVQLIGGDELLISTACGNATTVNLAKECKFFERFGLDKKTFKNEVFGTPEGRAEFLREDHYVRIGKFGNASLYDGLLYATEQEFIQQIELKDNANKAYTAHIISSNRGGYICNVQGIDCFMPGSQASGNKITDFESLVGTDTEVMVFKFIPKVGFLVSRKKFLQKILPAKMDELRTRKDSEPNAIYHGTVTGIGKNHAGKVFGVFVELNEFFTGLLHVTYASKELVEKINNGEISQGDELDVIIYSISDDDRIVLSDLTDAKTRDKVVAENSRIIAEENAAEEERIRTERAVVYAQKMKTAKKESKSDNSSKTSFSDFSDLEQLF